MSSAWHAVTKVFSAVGNAISSVVKTIGNTVKAIIKNPLPVIETVALTMAGVPPMIANAAVSAANGGSVKDIAIAAVSAGAGDFAGSAAGDAATAAEMSTANAAIAASAAGGSVAATVSGVLHGQDIGTALTNGLIAGVSAGAGTSVASTLTANDIITDPALKAAVAGSTSAATKAALTGQDIGSALASGAVSGAMGSIGNTIKGSLTGSSDAPVEEKSVTANDNTAAQNQVIAAFNQPSSPNVGTQIGSPTAEHNLATTNGYTTTDVQPGSDVAGVMEPVQVTGSSSDTPSLSDTQSDVLSSILHPELAPQYQQENANSAETPEQAAARLSAAAQDALVQYNNNPTVENKAIADKAALDAELAAKSVTPSITTTSTNPSASGTEQPIIPTDTSPTGGLNAVSGETGVTQAGGLTPPDGAQTDSNIGGLNAASGATDSTASTAEQNPLLNILSGLLSNSGMSTNDAKNAAGKIVASKPSQQALNSLFGMFFDQPNTKKQSGLINPESNVMMTPEQMAQRQQFLPQIASAKGGLASIRRK